MLNRAGPEGQRRIEQRLSYILGGLVRCLYQDTWDMILIDEIALAVAHLGTAVGYGYKDIAAVHGDGLHRIGLIAHQSQSGFSLGEFGHLTVSDQPRRQMSGIDKGNVTVRLVELNVQKGYKLAATSIPLVCAVHATYRTRTNPKCWLANIL